MTYTFDHIESLLPSKITKDKPILSMDYPSGLETLVNEMTKKTFQASSSVYFNPLPDEITARAIIYVMRYNLNPVCKYLEEPTEYFEVKEEVGVCKKCSKTSTKVFQPSCCNQNGSCCAVCWGKHFNSTINPWSGRTKFPKCLNCLSKRPKGGFLFKILNITFNQERKILESSDSSFRCRCTKRFFFLPISRRMMTSVICQCKYEFCFRCKQKTHLPLSCELNKKFHDICSEKYPLSLLIEYRTIESQKCPSVLCTDKKGVEKDPHSNCMRCRNCNKVWCFRCGTSVVSPNVSSSNFSLIHQACPSGSRRPPTFPRTVPFLDRARLRKISEGDYDRMGVFLDVVYMSNILHHLHQARKSLPHTMGESPIFLDMLFYCVKFLMYTKIFLYCQKKRSSADFRRDMEIVYLQELGKLEEHQFGLFIKNLEDETERNITLFFRHYTFDERRITEDEEDEDEDDDEEEEAMDDEEEEENEQPRRRKKKKKKKKRRRIRSNEKEVKRRRVLRGLSIGVQEIDRLRTPLKDLYNLIRDKLFQNEYFIQSFPNYFQPPTCHVPDHYNDDDDELQNIISKLEIVGRCMEGKNIKEFKESVLGSSFRDGMKYPSQSSNNLRLLPLPPPPSSSGGGGFDSDYQKALRESKLSYDNEREKKDLEMAIALSASTANLNIITDDNIFGSNNPQQQQQQQQEEQNKTLEEIMLEKAIRESLQMSQDMESPIEELQDGGDFNTPDEDDEMIQPPPPPQQQQQNNDNNNNNNKQELQEEEQITGKKKKRKEEEENDDEEEVEELYRFQPPQKRRKLDHNIPIKKEEKEEIEEEQEQEKEELLERSGENDNVDIKTEIKTEVKDEDEDEDEVVFLGEAVNLNEPQRTPPRVPFFIDDPIPEEKKDTRRK